MARTPRVVPFPRPQQPAITEQGVMRDFADANKDRYRYNHTSKTWLIWREHRWREDTRSRAFEAMLALCRAQGTGSTVNKVRFARAVEEGCRAQIEFATEAADWDQNPWLLGTPGGVVDLRSGELRDGRPEDLISKIAAVTPAADADCPRWLRFLDEALQGNADNIAFFQRFFGYCLTGVTNEEALLFIAGKSGAGKGTATKTMLTIMRDYALSVPISMFTDTGWRALEYYRAKLQGRRLVIASEPEKGTLWNDAFVNELTGGDRLSARHPAGRPFDFDPTHKLAINGEQVPDLRSVATGLRRRLEILPFEHAPESPDTSLKAALRPEFPMILRWAIDGCVRWQEIGLAPPPDVVRAVDEYFARQDIIARWIGERCELHMTFSTRPSELLSDYNEWAKHNNERPLNTNGLHDALKRKGFENFKLHGNAYWRGIALLSRL